MNKINSWDIFLAAALKNERTLERLILNPDQKVRHPEFPFARIVCTVPVINGRNVGIYGYPKSSPVLPFYLFYKFKIRTEEA